MPGSVEIEIVAGSDRLDPEDSRWSEQVGLFVQDLKRELGTVRMVREPVPGTKGGVDAIIVALGSAGAFTTALELLRAWLARERTRRVTVTYRDGQTSKQLTVRGTELDRDSFRALTELAIRRWPGTDG